MPFTSTNPSMHLHLLSTQAECKGHSLSVHLTKRKKVKIIKYYITHLKTFMFKYKLPKRDNLIFEYENKLIRLHKTLCLIWFIQILHRYKIDHSVFTNTYSWAKHFTLQKWTTTPFTTWMYVYIYRKFNIWSWYMFILIILNRINHKRPNTIEKLTAFKELPTIVNI